MECLVEIALVLRGEGAKSPGELWDQVQELGIVVGRVLDGLMGVELVLEQIALSATRRAERLALLERFIEVEAEAERAAFSRPAEFDDAHPWCRTAQDVMNRLWVAERLLRIRFPLPVHDAARAYFLDLNRTVWEGLPDGESVRDYLEDNRLAFLDAARAVMG